MIVKILGAFDLASSFAFVMLIFGIDVFTQYLLFCGVLLFIKGLFIFSGEPLSAIDVFSSILLILSIFLSITPILLWFPAFLLLAKGIVSFL